MSVGESTSHTVRVRRTARGWSQAELAKRAGISRAAVSAIEGDRLTPSVTAALSLAAVFGCSVEELFRRPPVSAPRGFEWAWPPRGQSCRYWEAEVAKRRVLYPVEAIRTDPLPHDGIWEDGLSREGATVSPDRTLTLASCDPAAGLLATEYARASGYRLLVFPRNSDAALDLVESQQVHVGGIHRSTPEQPDLNAQAVRAKLGAGHCLLRAAEWEEGVALPIDDGTRSVESVFRTRRRWAAREPGSAARECLEELLGSRHFRGRQVYGHPAVAEAVQVGWANAGICVRLCAEEAGLAFLPLRKECLDLCFSASMLNDPRIQALIRLLRGRSYRRLVSDLPGYDGRSTGEMTRV